MIWQGVIEVSQWDKLISEICSLSGELRFDELRKVLEHYGYTMQRPRGGAAIVPSESPAAARSPSNARTDQSGICADGQRSNRKRGIER